MKNLLTRSGILAVTGLAILATALPVRAENRLMRAEIPFPFVAGEQEMAAGTYWVRLDERFHLLDLSPAKERSVYRMVVKDSRQVRHVANPELGALSFRKYGSTFVFKGVYAPGETDRHDVKPSNLELELARTATPGSDSATVNVGLR